MDFLINYHWFSSRHQRTPTPNSSLERIFFRLSLKISLSLEYKVNTNTNGLTDVKSFELVGNFTHVK